jgi:geranylgeranyl pyrophosphate synthase
MGDATRWDADRRRIDEALAALPGRMGAPAPLEEAMAWPLLAGGKRLRPLLVLSARGMYGADGPDALPVACALELVHTYSLVHDDLPAMDDDDLRRGRPTCHVVYGDALAILAGDGLLTHAFQVVAEGCAGWPDRGLAVVAELARAAGPGGMVAGQAVDIVSTGRGLLPEAHRAMCAQKTGALLSAAVRCGALLGGAGPGDLEALGRYGRALGLAFQAVDDLLDAEGDPAEVGKGLHKDAEQGKTTFVDLLGHEGARAQAGAWAREAVEALAPFGDRAEGLRDLAERAVRRTR